MENTEISDALPPKPIKVEQAVNLIYGSLIVGILKLAVDAVLISENLSLGSIVCNVVITFGLIIFLALKISQGKNWARIIFAVLFAIGIIPTIIIIMQMFSVSPVSSILSIVQAIMQLIALIILFQEESATWFSLMSSKK